MAASLATEVPITPHACRALLLHLLAAVALLVTGPATSNVLVSAQHLNSAAHGATDATASTISIVDYVQSDTVSVFQTSKDHRVPCDTRLVRPPDGHNPPVRVIIASPTKNGTYPVILFKHGFLLANCFYTQLFESLASSGYIVVVPQAVTSEFHCTEEIKETANVANWIPISLEEVLKEALSNVNVVPDMSKLVMAGHSRGGKIAFAMALGMASTKLPSFSALISLDPVDGTASNSISNPPIVAPGCNNSRMSFPVLIFGAEYSSDKGMLGMPECAPTCCSAMAYFNCTSARIMYHLVASEYGHLDFLDDSQIWTPGMCKSGRRKAPLRNFAVKLMVTFLESALEGKEEGMDDIIKNWESASITLEEPQVKHTEDDALDVQREQMSKTILQEQHSECKPPLI